MRVALALAIFGSGFAQSTLAPVLRIGGVTPDLPLILAVLLALRKGPEVGCLAGFAAGLFQDVIGSSLVGAQAFTKALVGFGTGLLASRLWVSSALVQVPGLILLTLAEGVVRYGLLRLFQFPASLADLMLHGIVPQAFYNGFLGSAVVLALAWTEARRSGG